MNAARERWFEGQLDLDPTRIVFIDETAANTKMAGVPLRSCTQSERCRAAVPHGHWKTTTFTAGLRYDGIAAPMVLDGPMNGEAFLAYGTGARSRVAAIATSSSWTICPLEGPRRRQGPDRGRRRQPAIPRPDSPDFNPIEMAFAKLKALLRAAAARTIPDLWASLRQRPALLHPARMRQLSRRRRIRCNMIGNCSSSSTSVLTMRPGITRRFEEPRAPVGGRYRRQGLGRIVVAAAGEGLLEHGSVFGRGAR